MSVVSWICIALIIVLLLTIVLGSCRLSGEADDSTDRSHR